LLPDFDIYTDQNSNQARIDSLRFTTDAPAGNTVHLTDQKGNSVTIASLQGSGNSMFADYLILTRYVADVTGAPVQEAYVGLFRQSDNGWVPVPSENGKVPTLSKDAAYRARIVTVQGRPGGMAWPLPLSKCPDETTFWEAMFASHKSNSGSPPDSIPYIQDKERLRIVGLSRPIEMLNSVRNRIC
jgi:hypothetical protein